MTRQVAWTETALADLVAQAEHIAKDDPDAATRVAVAIRKTGDLLSAFATGHPGRVAGTYEKSVRGLPFIIAYALADGDTTLSILRVIHTARDWQNGNWPE